MNVFWVVFIEFVLVDVVVVDKWWVVGDMVLLLGILIVVKDDVDVVGVLIVFGI